MNRRARYIISLLLVSLTFVMMISIEPIGAPGDYIVKWLGLKAWSLDQSGFHVTLIYFGIPFFMSLRFLRKHRRELSISGLKTFILVIVLISGMSYTIVEIAEFTKARSEGLLVIGYDREESTYEIELTPDYTKFDIQVKVTNYGNDTKYFTLAIDSELRRYQDKNPIRFMNKTGEEAEFKLEGKSTEVFRLTSEEFELKNCELGKGIGHSSRSGEIQELILGSPDGEVVKLIPVGYFGLVIEVAK